MPFVAETEARRKDREAEIRSDERKMVAYTLRERAKNLNGMFITQRADELIAVAEDLESE